MTVNDDIKERERRENETARVIAQIKNKSVTFTASDGCEVTVTPDGHVFHNAKDWW